MVFTQHASVVSEKDISMLHKGEQSFGYEKLLRWVEYNIQVWIALKYSGAVEYDLFRKAKEEFVNLCETIMDLVMIILTSHNTYFQ